MMGAVRLTRVVRFSAGHRYWFESLSQEQNERLFGELASCFSHGHNYVLSATVEGEVDPLTGMVINIKDIDKILLDRIVALLDRRSINDEVPEFKETAPCLENLLHWCKDKIEPDLPAEVTIVKLKLEEMPDLWAEWNMPNQLTITRQYEFAASHRLYSSAHSEVENLQLFGKCTNPNGHGHNYLLDVVVTGMPSPGPGFIFDISRLDHIVEESILLRYDHKNLNLDVPELTGKNPTSEVVAQEIFSNLSEVLGNSLVLIRLHETARNIFEVGR